MDFPRWVFPGPTLRQCVRIPVQAVLAALADRLACGGVVADFAIGIGAGHRRPPAAVARQAEVAASPSIGSEINITEPAKSAESPRAFAAEDNNSDAPSRAIPEAAGITPTENSAPPLATTSITDPPATEPSSEPHCPHDSRRARASRRGNHFNRKRRRLCWLALPCRSWFRSRRANRCKRSWASSFKRMTVTFKSRI